jgi:hypothetical protein
VRCHQAAVEKPETVTSTSYVAATLSVTVQNWIVEITWPLVSVRVNVVVAALALFALNNPSRLAQA